MSSTNHNLCFSQQNFADEILQHANNTFSVIYHRFLKEIWSDNKTTKKLHSNQVYTDWQNGRYECYIPTRDSVDNNLEFSRIAIQILPMVSNEEKHREAYHLAEPIKTPLGKIESELLLLIAPRQHHWGLVKGFKHRNKPGYFTCVFVNKSPDIIWKRVLDQVTNFFKKRLNGLMTSLNIADCTWKWTIGKRNDFISNIVVEKYSYVLRQSYLTFKSLIEHLLDKMKAVLGEIGVQNVALQALHVLKGLNVSQLGRVFSEIRRGLNVEVDFERDALRVLEVARHG